MLLFQQEQTVSKAVIYGSVGGGVAALILIVIVISVLVFKMRKNEIISVTDSVQMKEKH